MTVGEQERMAFSEDAAQFLKIRPDGDGCIEIEAINHIYAVKVCILARCRSPPEGTNSMPEENRSAMDALAEEAGRRVNTPECPFCRANDWARGDDLIGLYYIGDFPIGGEPGLGFGVLPFACRGCGFVRLHSEQVLRKLMS